MTTYAHLGVPRFVGLAFTVTVLAVLAAPLYVWLLGNPKKGILAAVFEAAHDDAEAFALAIGHDRIGLDRRAAFGLLDHFGKGKANSPHIVPGHTGYSSIRSLEKNIRN